MGGRERDDFDDDDEEEEEEEVVEDAEIWRYTFETSPFIVSG